MKNLNKLVEGLNNIQTNVFHIHAVDSRCYLIEDIYMNEYDYTYSYCHCAGSERRVKKCIKKLLKKLIEKELTASL